jgi:hypothetical protein
MARRLGTPWAWSSPQAGFLARRGTLWRAGHVAAFPGTYTFQNLLELLRGNEWHARAVCPAEDPALFDCDLRLGQDRHLASPMIRAAFLVCARCPVRRECVWESVRRVLVPLTNDLHTEAPAAGL